MSEPAIALIVAVAENGVIGNAGQMPWRQGSDLKTFRRLTMGKPIIMGRKTFQSIGKALDGRPNLVVTRDAAFKADGVAAFTTLEAAIGRARDLVAAHPQPEIMVIGGAEIYALALPHATRIYWTEIHAKPDGDTTFPALDLARWRVVSRQPIASNARDDFPATLVIYERALA